MNNNKDKFKDKLLNIKCIHCGKELPIEEDIINNSSYVKCDCKNRYTSFGFYIIHRDNSFYGQVVVDNIIVYCYSNKTYLSYFNSDYNNQNCYKSLVLNININIHEVSLNKLKTLIDRADKYNLLQ